MKKTLEHWLDVIRPWLVIIAALVIIILGAVTIQHTVVLISNAKQAAIVSEQRREFAESQKPYSEKQLMDSIAWDIIQGVDGKHYFAFRYTIDDDDYTGFLYDDEYLKELEFNGRK